MSSTVCFKVDAWLIADKHIRFRSSQGELLALADTCTDIGAHESIYDSNVNSRIEDSEDPAVEPAKVLLNRIERRDFYQAVCTVDVSKLGPESVRNMTAKQILDEIKSFVCSEEEGGGDQGQTRPLRKDDFTAFTNKITAGVTTDKVLYLHSLLTNLIYFTGAHFRFWCTTRAARRTPSK